MLHVAVIAHCKKTHFHKRFDNFRRFMRVVIYWYTKQMYDDHYIQLTILGTVLGRLEIILQFLTFHDN